jgi:aspartate kinase
VSVSVIMKFGGTSVADADAMTRVVNIVRGRREAQPARDALPVVVVSALSKVTDGLIRTARFIQGGDAASALSLVNELLERHVGIASSLTSAGRQDELVTALRAQFAELAALVGSLAAVRDVSPRSHDAIVATGELVSSRIVAAAFAERGLPAVWVDARKVLVTDAEHTMAAPDMKATCAQARDQIAPVTARGGIPVLGGFIGASADGVTTTLGRGGSDYSAAIFGACLDAREIQIWTDVDGMLTADPRIVPEPRVVPQLSFAEASELAYFGAKVLHPSTILPAVSKNIPVRILNSRRPESPGTLITAEGRPQGPLAALACKRDVTVVHITSSRMLMAHGFLRRLFEVFERFKTAVDVVTTSEVSVSVTVDDTRRLDDIVASLREFSEVACEPKMAIVSVVGEKLHEDPTLFARAIVSLGRIPLRLVSQAASRRNITLVLSDADVAEAMTRLHEALFETPTILERPLATKARRHENEFFERESS